MITATKNTATHAAGIGLLTPIAVILFAMSILFTNEPKPNHATLPIPKKQDSTFVKTLLYPVTHPPALFKTRPNEK